MKDPFKYEATIRRGKPIHNGDYFSIRHPSMDYGKRAKIFAPFAALKGFEEEVQSKEVRYERQRELDADELYELNKTLNILYERTQNGRRARQDPCRAKLTWFVPCEDTHNEAYHTKGLIRTVSGIVQRVDPAAQNLRIEDIVIPFSQIYTITLLPDDP